MTDKRELYRKAHAVIDALVLTEPTHDGIDDLDRWRKAVRNRIRAENWAVVVDVLEDDPTADTDDIASSIRQAITDMAQLGKPPEPPNPSALLPNVDDVVPPWKSLPPDERQRAREHIAAIRASLSASSEETP